MAAAPGRRGVPSAVSFSERWIRVLSRSFYERFCDTGWSQRRRQRMTKEQEHELLDESARMQQEHRDLDAAIAALQDSPGSDILQIQRLKKRKLHLRDRITFIEDQLTPDIIA